MFYVLRRFALSSEHVQAALDGVRIRCFNCKSV